MFSDGVHFLSGSADSTAKVWKGLLRKAPLQLEAEMDAAGAFNIIGTTLGSGCRGQLVFERELVKPSHLENTLSDSFLKGRRV